MSTSQTASRCIPSRVRPNVPEADPSYHLSHLCGDRLRFATNGVPGSLVGVYADDDQATLVALDPRLDTPLDEQLVVELVRVGVLYLTMAVQVQDAADVRPFRVRMIEPAGPDVKGGAA